MQIITTIECDPEVELVARTLYAYNSYPGRRPREIPWPPKLKQQISHYVRLAEAVVKAQRDAGYRGAAVGNEFPNGYERS
jgi:hypothetical protein